MASAFSHIVVATAIGKCLNIHITNRRYWVVGAVLSVLPDLDVIGFGLGIQYGDQLGHRGLTHSLFFAALIAAIAARWVGDRDKIARGRLFVFFFLATASHGVLDALTNGGLGVAFFAPFSNVRYFFSFRPVEVSPIGVSRFFSARGLEILKSEFVWLWLPSLLLSLFAEAAHRLSLKLGSDCKRNQ